MHFVLVLKVMEPFKMPQGNFNVYCVEGAHLGGGRINPLLLKRNVSLSRPFAPKMPDKGLK